ncbi:TPA: hypothetical protein MYO72_004928 [Citrobacter freundii]|nr:hypothetical protein [Citrobacter freundii]HCB1519368.1 hypothetical protein [Citrobacter freundii]
MNRITEGKKYCYRYYDGNDSEGCPIVTMHKRVIIRETDKTFWHVEDFPHMNLEQLINYWTGGRKEDRKKYIKRCYKGADRSRYHYTKEGALKAFIYRKKYQLSRIQLTAETVSLCLKGLKDAGFVTYTTDQYGFQQRSIAGVPDGDYFLAAQEPGPIASTYSWGEC